MEEKRYSEAGSVASNTITEIQKEHIRASILKAIENGAYHPGLEDEHAKQFLISIDLVMLKSKKS